MAKYQKYAEYKDSGVEWLGEIPSHWNLYSLKRSVDKCTNGFWGAEPDGINDLCVLRVADFNRDNFLINENKLTFRSIQPKEAENRLLKKGDLLIEKSGGGDKTLVGCVVMFDKEFSAITSNFVAKMTPNINTDSKYLTYSFAHLYSGRVNFPSIKQTTGIQNLDSEAYLIEKFGFPPKNEQTQIANFLDHETAKIDSLIEKQQQLIELLKEKRQAVISHAVTKGLNPDVAMKDSGVEWLGQVPEHWRIIKLSQVALAFNGDRGSNYPSGNDFVDEGIYFISASEIIDSRILTETASKISQKKYEILGGLKIKKGDIIYCLRGAGVGKNGICDFDEGTVSSSLMGIRSIKLDPEYLVLLLNSSSELQQRSVLVNGSVSPNLSAENVMGYKFAIPSVNEQMEIKRDINFKIKDLDNLLAKAESAIQLIQERRTTLISAAVTGKIDVRNWQNPNNNNEAKTEFSA